MTHHHTRTQLRLAQAENLIRCLRNRGIDAEGYGSSVSMRIKEWESLPFEMRESIRCLEHYMAQVLEIELGEMRQMKWKRPNRKGNT